MLASCLPLTHNASSFSILIFLFLLSHSLSLTSTQHYRPLDPLTPSELNQVRTIVKGSNGNPVHNFTFHYIGLEEPDKPTILQWLSHHPTKNPPRRALVIARVDKKLMKSSWTYRQIQSYPIESTMDMATPCSHLKNKRLQTSCH